MTAAPSSVRARSAIASLAGVAMLASACGGVERDVQVPGADPVMAPVDHSDSELFTRGTTVTEPVSDTSSDFDVVPATTTIATTTTLASNTDASSDAVPRVVPGTVPSPPASGVPSVIMPTVTGWAAFDLHLATILHAGSPAVSATVMRHGEVIHEVALGERTAAGDPIAIGDRYRVASISKVVTAITVLRLVEQGAIGLDDLIGERLAARVGVASPVAGVEQITVRHLLTHRSGIGQYENLMFRRQVESCDQAAAIGFSQGLERAPGTTMRYSNLNFCMLGLLIEDVTDRAYEDVVRTELLGPLDIADMRLAGTFEVAAGDVEHRSDEGRNYMEVLEAAGSWIASPTDVATIINAIDLSTPGWKPLGSDSIAQMTAITVTLTPPPDSLSTTSTTLEAPPPPTTGYGMGLMIFGPDSFGHTGTLESTHAMTARQSDGITWAITVSGDHPSSTRDLAGVVAEALRYAGPV